MRFTILVLLLATSMGLFAGNRVDIKMMDRHVKDFATRKSKEGYYLCGEGGAMMGNIKRVCLDFDLKKKVDLDEARRLVVNLVEEFNSGINQDEQLRPYLNNYPFNHTNSSFSISFKNKDHQFLQEGIALALVSGNYIHYSTSPGEEGMLLKRLTKERYEDALQKVREEKAAPKESISPPSS